MQCPILIAGPTASGKTALAIQLAQELGGAIINADSMQVYEGLPILSASPTNEERRLVPHHLFNHVNPHDQYNVGDWLAEVQSALVRIEEQGQRAIIVGGTGLYFRALTHGLVEMPEIDPAFRQMLLQEMDEKGSAALHAALSLIDQELAARVHVNDRQRIMRGLEVYRATGKALSAWQKELTAAPILKTDNRICLMPSRQWLYDRCDRRFEQMIEANVLDEVSAFRSRPESATGASAKTLGLAELGAYLDGESTLEAALERAKMQTRRYAKRQMTWYRNQMIAWECISEQYYYHNIDKIFSIISK